MGVREIFHVHTRRCGHSSMETDESYVVRALELGAGRITFTDHAPFPGNPFSNRMKYEELEEYISSLKELKLLYEGRIDVRIGLEIEYLPGFRSYYKELKDNPDIEILMIGQHHYEISPGRYNFELPRGEVTPEDGYRAFSEAQEAAMETGWFDVLAHPERIFRKAESWQENMEVLAKKVIAAALKNNVVLEYNMKSERTYPEIQREFWKLVPADAPCIDGCDAHRTSELLISREDIRIKGQRRAAVL